MKPFAQSKLSVVTPVYRNETTLRALCERVFAVATQHFEDVEYVFVNDGSPDGSRQVLQAMAAADSRVKVINLARNFGQHVALMVGLERVTGDYIMMIDADLEESPEQLPLFLTKLGEGFEIAVGKRVGKRRGWFRRLGSGIYAGVFNRLSDLRIQHEVSTLRLMTARYAQFLVKFSERPFFSGFTAWIGLPIALVPIEWDDQARKSSYTLRRLLAHARIGLVGFSNRPIRFAFGFGLVVTTLTILFAVVMMIVQLVHGGVPIGYTSIVALITFLMGMQFIFIGLLGEYIGEIFLVVKRRPPYLIYDRFNLESANEATSTRPSMLSAR